MKTFPIGLDAPQPLLKPEGGDGGGGAAAGGGASDGNVAGAAAADAGGQAEGGGAGNAADATPAGGATDAGWLSGLSEDHRTYIGAKGYKTPGDLINAYHSAERMIGLDKVALPKADSPKEVHDAFYKAIGRPDDAAGYGFAAPKDFKEYDPQVSAAFAAKAHELGMPKAMAIGIHDWFMGMAAQAMGGNAEAIKAMHAGNQAKLQESWGLTFAAKNEQANRAIRHFGGDALVAELKRTNLYSNPVLNEAFQKIGAAMGGDSLAGAGSGGGATMTPDEAKAEIRKLESDRNGPLYDQQHPEHKFAVERKSALYTMAYPDRAA